LQATYTAKQLLIRLTPRRQFVRLTNTHFQCRIVDHEPKSDFLDLAYGKFRGYGSRRYGRCGDRRRATQNYAENNTGHKSRQKFWKRQLALLKSLLTFSNMRLETWRIHNGPELSRTKGLKRTIIERGMSPGKPGNLFGILTVSIKFSDRR